MKRSWVPPMGRGGGRKNTAQSQLVDQDFKGNLLGHPLVRVVSFSCHQRSSLIIFTTDCKHLVQTVSTTYYLAPHAHGHHVLVGGSSRKPAAGDQRSCTMMCVGTVQLNLKSLLFTNQDWDRHQDAKDG